MLDQIKQATSMSQGFFVAAFGLIGVFLVLILFYFVIRLLHKLPFKD